MELEAHQPQLLYYTALPRRWLKIFSWFLRLRGHDPTAIGRNKDIDLTHLGYPQENLHTAINYSPYWDIKMRASAAHASQGGGGMNRLLPAWLQKRLLSTDTYIRAYPPTPDGFRDYDLFNGYHK